MAHKTDMAKAKRKSEEERERAARMAAFGRRADWWKPLPGTNKIRILPPWTDAGPNRNQWWREVWMHYGVTNLEAPDEDNQFAVPCPHKSPDGKHVVGGGEAVDCKICKLVEELRSGGNPADIETAKNIKAKMRLYINMIDLNDPVWTEDDVTKKKANGCPEDQLPTIGEPKVQVYNFGPNIFKELLDAYQDDVDVADLDEGHDIVIEREGEGLKTKYRVRAQMKATAAPIKDEQLDDNMWNMDTLVPYFSDEQVDLILEGGTREDVFALNQPLEPAQLPESTETEEPSEADSTDDDSSSDDDENQEAASSEPEDPTVLDPDSIPVDGDGDILFDQLSDEQIENPVNAAAEVTNNNGDTYSAHVSCFGDQKERNPEDDTCKDCFLFERCGKRIEFKEEQAKKAAAAKKKGGPGKKKSPGKPTPGKKAPGKGNGAKAKEETKATSPAPAANQDDLEAQMLAAMGKK